VDGRQDGGWRVTIDGRAWRTSMVRAGDRWSLLVHEPSAAPLQLGTQLRCRLRAWRGGAWRVHVNGATVPAAWDRRRGSGGRLPPMPPTGASSAPIAGRRVVKVLVTPGTRVEARERWWWSRR
jgi:hypothetical protein